MAPVNRYLAIYLNDHLAGATLGLELVRRASKEHHGELAEFLHELRDQIEQDYRALLEVMAALGVKRSRVKPAVAWAAEKVGRLGRALFRPRLRGGWFSPWCRSLGDPIRTGRRCRSNARSAPRRRSSIARIH
jgi:hypothetical protein